MSPYEYYINPNLNLSGTPFNIRLWVSEYLELFTEKNNFNICSCLSIAFDCTQISLAFLFLDNLHRKSRLL